MDDALSVEKGRKHHIPFGTICSLIQLYIGYDIQYPNPRNDCLQMFTTTNFLSSQLLRLCTEEFLPFFIMGPGTSNYTAKFSFSQVFHPLTEALLVICDLVLLATYVISQLCLLEHTTTTHILQAHSTTNILETPLIIMVNTN